MTQTSMTEKNGDSYVHHPDITGPQPIQPDLEVVPAGLNPVEPSYHDYQSPTVIDSAHPNTLSPAYTANWTPAYGSTSAKSSDDADDKAQALADSSKTPDKGTVRRSTFILFIVAALLLVLAVGLGAGLGVSMHKNRSVNSAPSPTITATATPTSSPIAGSTPSNTTTGTFAIPTTGFAPLDCPALDGKNYTSVVAKTNAVYKLKCDTLWSNLHWLVTFPAYSLDTCIQACTIMNDKLNKKLCYGVTFVADLRQIQSMGGNCFLKNDTGPYMKKPSNERWIAAELDSPDEQG